MEGAVDNVEMLCELPFPLEVWTLTVIKIQRAKMSYFNLSPRIHLQAYIINYYKLIIINSALQHFCVSMTRKYIIERNTTCLSSHPRV